MFQEIYFIFKNEFSIGKLSPQNTVKQVILNALNNDNTNLSLQDDFALDEAAVFDRIGPFSVLL